PADAVARRRRHGALARGADTQGSRYAHTARGADPAAALRHRREVRLHPRGGRAALRGDARAHPADRSQGAPQAAQPEPGPNARNLRAAAVAPLEERDAREPGEGAEEVASEPRRFQAPARGGTG